MSFMNNITIPLKTNYYDYSTILISYHIIMQENNDIMYEQCSKCMNGLAEVCSSTPKLCVLSLYRNVIFLYTNASWFIYFEYPNSAKQPLLSLVQITHYNMRYDYTMQKRQVILLQFMLST